MLQFEVTFSIIHSIHTDLEREIFSHYTVTVIVLFNNNIFVSS